MVQTRVLRTKMQSSVSILWPTAHQMHGLPCREILYFLSRLLLLCTSSCSVPPLGVLLLPWLVSRPSLPPCIPSALSRTCDGTFLSVKIFLRAVSPHKFVGGVSTPGVLVLKKNLVHTGGVLGRSGAPPNPGGGTVFFVTEEAHRYLYNLEEREEGGTPDIVGSIRCGLVFRLKEAVGHQVIMEKEHQVCIVLRFSALLRAFTFTPKF